MFGDIFIQIKKMYILGGVLGLEQGKGMYDGELIILLLIRI
jgi:hypothetical protein